MTQLAKNRQSKGSKLTKAEADAAIGLARVSKTAHGLVQGDVIRESALNTYITARASSETKIGVGLAFVFDVLDANNYSIARAGTSRHLTFTGHGLAGGFGTKLYLSQGTSGLITVTRPSSGWIVYLGYIVDANTIGWEPGAIAFEE